ncbi:MAG: anaerobic sulfatase maturase [Myxococcota bacterium]|jgi:uncharacterized protein
MEEFFLMAKPAGPSCNLRCGYCFYREKKGVFPKGASFRMSDEVLDAYTREYIRAHPGPTVVFEWQGGEPTLMGLAFFERALELQKKYGGGKQIANSLQTNGTLIDDAWCDFLFTNKFLVGLSLDGPAEIHDACRTDKEGRPTSGRVLDSLGMMLRRGVEVNVIATVNRKSSGHPVEVYRFFREQGVRFIQFIPVVERVGVEPERYGTFLTGVFDEWIKNDVGRIFVMNFEWCLGGFAGAGPGVCYLAPTCGQNMIMEFNGDIYSCDHFMYPAYRIGNILDGNLERIVASKRQLAFGASKETTLPEHCRRCEFLFACRGGCPKHRFATTPDGAPGLNYLCTGLMHFFRHVDPSMKRMVELLRSGTPVQKIMEWAGH